jgi:hypothetical protein
MYLKTMNFKRILLLVFAAALTAGTSAAAPILFTGYAGISGTQSLSVTIDGFLIASGAGPAQAFNTTVEESDGWHTISIDYKSSLGTSYLNLQVNSDGAALADLQSLNASGTPIYGLKGQYSTLGGVPIRTDYGVGPLYFPTFSSPSSGFELILTGKIYFGPNPAPALDQIAPPPPVDPPPTDPPPTGDGNVPEPGGLWLVAAALPLILFSKRNLILAKIRQS